MPPKQRQTRKRSICRQARKEFERLKRVDYAQEGRRQKSKMPEKEVVWKQTVERKVVEKHGMTLNEISSRLDAVCKEAGFAAGCSEDDLVKQQKQ